MRLLLVRHPQPVIETGICYGRSDLDVSAAQLAHARRQLANDHPTARAIYTSPLQRCAKLAQQLAEHWNLPAPDPDARLAEIDFGQWELQRWDDIPRPEIDAWAADLVHYQPGGGESVLQMAVRVHDFYQHWQRQQHDAMVICHAGTIRLLQCCHAGLAPTAMALQAAQHPHHIAYGSTLLLET